MPSIHRSIIIVTILAIAASCVPSALAESKSATTKPAGSKAVKVPDNILAEINKRFARPRQRMTRQELMALLLKRMEKVLQLGEQAEKDYPKADNLHEVQSAMLQAAGIVAKINQTEADKARHQAIAKKILKSDAPPKSKVLADLIVTQAKVLPAEGKPAPDAAKQIRQFAKRYAKTDAAGTAYIYSALLAEMAQQPDLAEQMYSVLEKKYRTDPKVAGFLKRMGRSPKFRNKPFKAKLTRLDGKKLSLPKDLLGKVVVIDFWATWCGPCVAELPHMKKLYAKYKDKGVEFVGISLDKDRKRLEDFVKKQGMAWIQTFSGKGWQDPTAQACEIRSIPSIWVVGKDGNIISSNARRNLEQVIEKALKQK